MRTHVIIFLLVALVMAISVVLLIRLAHKNDAKLRESMIALIITIAGTFFGVFLAIYLGEVHNQQLEKEQLRQMFGLVIIEMSGQYLLLEEKTKKGEVAEIIAEVDRFPRSAPANLDAVLASPLLIKHAPAMLAPLTVERNHLTRNIQDFSSPNADMDRRMTGIRHYQINIRIIGKMIDAGYRYIDGEVSAAEYNTLANKAIKDEFNR